MKACSELRFSQSLDRHCLTLNLLDDTQPRSQGPLRERTLGTRLDDTFWGSFEAGGSRTSIESGLRTTGAVRITVGVLAMTTATPRTKPCKSSIIILSSDVATV